MTTGTHSVVQAGAAEPDTWLKCYRISAVKDDPYGEMMPTCQDLIKVNAIWVSDSGVDCPEILRMGVFERPLSGWWLRK